VRFLTVARETFPRSYPGGADDQAVICDYDVIQQIDGGFAIIVIVAIIVSGRIWRVVSRFPVQYDFHVYKDRLVNRQQGSVRVKPWP